VPDRPVLPAGIARLEHGEQCPAAVRVECLLQLRDLVAEAGELLAQRGLAWRIRRRSRRRIVEPGSGARGDWLQSHWRSPEIDCSAERTRNEQRHRQRIE
jgi:hypothetical protein